VDNSIKTEQDIERYGAGVTVLGHVPLYEPLRVVYGGGDDTKKREEGEEAVALTPPTADLASHETPRSSFGESFKNLRTSLLLASPNQPPRHIQVTSCEPGEGKSTIVLNLAVVLAQMGKKVLLVDTDLRRPRLHSALELPNDVGLSSYLTGNAEPEELFQECPVPGLSVITSGPMPPNPSELLGSPRLDSLIEQLKENGGYDHVLFDSPPVIQVADSMIIATKMDATILIVRAGMTARESLAQGVARLRQGRAKVIGAVLNAISEKSRYYYYRRYGYHRRSAYYSHTGAHDGDQSEATGALAALTKKMKLSRQRRAG
jgi:capsular exopolysaccharide synthesis family protein